jgi:hypothetical protein
MEPIIGPLEIAKSERQWQGGGGWKTTMASSLHQKRMFLKRVRFAVSSLLVFHFFFLSLLEHNLAVLLKKHNKKKDAEALMRGELAVLNLNHCRIGDDGARVVAAFLIVNDTLKGVALWNCNIGAQGARALADALKHNKTVWGLDLSGNPIADLGADSLIDTLSHNVCLTDLQLVYSNIAPESEATIEYLTKTRNKILIPTAARRASLYLIAARRVTADAGVLSWYPREIVKMIAIEVWATRYEPEWIAAVSSEEHMENQKQYVNKRIQ